MPLLIANLILLFFIIRLCIAGYAHIRQKRWEELARVSFFLCVVGVAGFMIEPIFAKM